MQLALEFPSKGIGHSTYVGFFTFLNGFGEVLVEKLMHDEFFQTLWCDTGGNGGTHEP